MSADAAAAAAPAAAGAEGGAPQPKIDPTKDLWHNITANVREAATEQVEQNILVVGARGSGKTSIIYRMLGLTSAPKSTTALEYFYGRREERNTTQIAHFWELGQGNELAQLSEIVLTPETVHTATVLVVVDCGDLTGMWDTLQYWLKRLDRRVQDIFQKMRAKNSTTPDKLIQRHKRRIGEEHPDLAQLRVMGVPLVIVASRMDLIKEDTVKTKTLIRTLRFVAHLYGASLLVTCDQEREAVKLRALLSHMIFGVPFDQRHVQTEFEKGGLLIPAGSDSFREIGAPNPVTPPGFKPSGDAEMDKWKAPFDEAYPPKVVRDRQHVDDDFLAQLVDVEKGSGEPVVDAMRKQKDEELEMYRKTAMKRQLASEADGGTK